MPMKKISLPVIDNHMRHRAMGAPLCIRMEGFYMVELAVVLPFFAGFLAALLFFFQALTVQQEVGNTLLAAGRELSVLACREDKSEAAMAAYVRGRMLTGLKADSAADRFIRYGRMGIRLTQSDFSGSYIYLQADYGLRLPFGLFGKREIRMTQRLKCRKWIGQAADGGTKEEIVYITPAGSVYHRKRECSYLSPSVSSTKKRRVGRLRNENGGKYYPCEACVKGADADGGTVYITKFGDRYHSRRDCAKIRRTVYAVRLSEVKGRNACVKCGRE